MRVIAVIPCYNEGKTIAQVVSKAKKHCHRVIVVDNMSTDNTIDEVRNEIPCYNIYTCYVQGAGITTRYGLIYSMNPRKNLRGDIMVTLDGDGQHDADEIPKLVEPIEKGEADVVVGTRFLENNGMPKYRKFGIGVITWLYNLGSKRRLSDAQCCFRAFSRESLIYLLPVNDHGFSFSVEMLVKARAKGLRIAEVPVSCIYHKKHGRNSTMNPVRHGLGVVFGLLKWRLKVKFANLFKIKKREGKK